jgi:hypothetical protein
MSESRKEQSSRTDSVSSTEACASHIHPAFRKVMMKRDQRFVDKQRAAAARHARTSRPIKPD